MVVQHRPGFFICILKSVWYTITMKLSERAIILLEVVNKATIRNWDTGVLSRYYYPHVGTVYLENPDRHTSVGGAGDAAALKGLANRGLIEHIRAANPYCYAITESGRLALQERGKL